MARVCLWIDLKTPWVGIKKKEPAINHWIFMLRRSVGLFLCHLFNGPHSMAPEGYGSKPWRHMPRVQQVLSRANLSALFRRRKLNAGSSQRKSQGLARHPIAAVLLFLGELLFAFLPTAFRRAKAGTAFRVAFFLWRKRNDRNSISTFLNYPLISR